MLLMKGCAYNSIFGGYLMVLVLLLFICRGGNWGIEVE